MLTLSELVTAIPHCWSVETRGGESFTGKHPAAGQCTVSSLLIQKYCGGSIIGCTVGSSKYSHVKHYFNELPGGVRVDVTAGQFSKQRVMRQFKVNPDGSTYIFGDTWARVEILEHAVRTYLWAN